MREDEGGALELSSMTLAMVKVLPERTGDNCRGGPGPFRRRKGRRLARLDGAGLVSLGLVGGVMSWKSIFVG